MKINNLTTIRAAYRTFIPLIVTVAIGSVASAQSPEMFGFAGPNTMGGFYGGGGMGPYGGGGFGAGPQQQQFITVKEGEIVYCAAFQDLIEYNVYYRQVPVDQLDEYYDDGTHGDEIANDGVPSKIEIVDNEFLGPFAIAYYKQLNYALDCIRYNFEGKERQNYPLKFYGIKVAEVPIYSQSMLTKEIEQEDVEGLLPSNRVPRYRFVENQLVSQVNDMRKRLLEPFLRPDGTAYNMEKYEKNVDITRLESSMEFAIENQQGGMAGGGGFGGGAMPGPVGVGNIALQRTRDLPGAAGGGEGEGGGGE